MRSDKLIGGLIFAFTIGVAALACDPPETDGAPDESQGAAEVTEDGPADIDDGGIDAIPDDPQLVEKGEDLFHSEGCSACHQMDSDAAGPALGDVTQRRSASWLAKQIMHPRQMQDKDPETQALQEEFPAPMTPANIDAEQTRAILAFLDAQN